MVQVEKTSSAHRPTTAGRRGRGAVAGAVAYALKANGHGVLKEPVPEGVRIALVPSSPEAEARLKAWAPVRRVGRLAPAERTGSGTASGSIAKADFEPDARSRALLRGVEIARADLKAAGGAFELAEVCSLLNGVSRQRVMERVKQGSLLAVPGPSNRRRYPTLQFTRDGGVVEGLREVQAALPTRNPWAILNFFTRPDDRLDGRTPIEVLKTGDVARVVAAARSVGVQGG